MRYGADLAPSPARWLELSEEDQTIAVEEFHRRAKIRELSCDGVKMTCVSYLEPGTFKNARYQVRRLRKHMPEVPVMALFWGIAGDHSRHLDGIEATECDIVTTGLKESVQHVLAYARRTATSRPVIQAAK